MSTAEMSTIIKELYRIIDLMEYQPDDPMYQDEFASGHFKGFSDGCAYSAGLLRKFVYDYCERARGTEE